MNPDAKKWVLICFVAFIAVAVSAYFSFFAGRADGVSEAKKEMRAQIDSLDRVKSVLQKRYDSIDTHDRLISRKIDTLHGRDSILRQLLLNTNSALITVEDKYTRLKYIDTLSSNGLRDYFGRLDSIENR